MSWLRSQRESLLNCAVLSFLGNRPLPGIYGIWHTTCTNKEEEKLGLVVDGRPSITVMDILVGPIFGHGASKPSLSTESFCAWSVLEFPGREHPPPDPVN